eukprot:Clim_evm25s11 gene=Clim_evmTU25s11
MEDDTAEGIPTRVFIAIVTAVAGLLGLVALRIYERRTNVGVNDTEEDEPARNFIFNIDEDPRQAHTQQHRAAPASTSAGPGTSRKGTKYMQKQERKQAMARYREAQEAQREEKERREEEWRKLQKKREEAQEKAAKREQAKLDMELAKREAEEEKAYKKLRGQFEVAETGEDGDGDLEDGEQIAMQSTSAFVEYIQRHRLVRLARLGGESGLSVPQVAERIQSLEEDGQLRGVFDGRGTYIYLEQEDYEALAEFVADRGRVSIPEITAFLNSGLAAKLHQAAENASQVNDGSEAEGG